MYYNYKGTHSIILLALCDANYEFKYAEIGTNGRASDGAVWEVSPLRRLIEQGSIGIPGATTLPGTDKVVPYVILADDAFPLSKYLLKPYRFRTQNQLERIFSYRLSRARRTIENAFGILVSKFRVFLAPINLEPQKVEKIVLAALVLNNMMRRLNPQDFPLQNSDGVQIADSWQQAGGLMPLQHLGRNVPNDAKQIRQIFANYFNGEGAVPWQNTSI